MLTPQEISEKEFVKAVFGGYDMAVVDEFDIENRHYVVSSVVEDDVIKAEE